VRRDVPPVRAAPKPAPPAAVAPQPPDDGPWEVSPQGTKWRASTAPRGRGADWDNARVYFRAPDINDWMRRMRRDPDLFTQLLSDIYRETRAEQARRARKARIGRRPKVIDGALNQLWDMVTPNYSNDRFPEAIGAVVGDLTPEQVAKRTGLSVNAYQHMLAGEGLEMWRLEALARAFEFSPSYFLEWRQAYVLTVVQELLELQPGLATRYVRALDRAVGPAQPSRQAKQLARA